MVALVALAVLAWHAGSRLGGLQFFSTGLAAGAVVRSHRACDIAMGDTSAGLTRVETVGSIIEFDDGKHPHPLLGVHAPPMHKTSAHIRPTTPQTSKASKTHTSDAHAHISRAYTSHAHRTLHTYTRLPRMCLPRTRTSHAHTPHTQSPQMSRAHASHLPCTCLPPPMHASHAGHRERRS